MAEETILLHFDIDEQPAVNSIKDLRSANSQLRAERDKVNIATKEGQELVQKLNVQIDKNNKLIKDNSSALEKQRQNVGNYTDSIKDAAGELNIMGTNVNAVSQRLASFANPATAAIGIATALAAAYARSSIGAKDLEFAQNQLNFVLDTATDRFASVFSSVEDGEGALTKYINAYLKVGFYSPVGQALRLFGIDLKEIAKDSREAAQAIEDLNNIRDEAALNQASINERLAVNADLSADIANADISALDRLKIADKIRENINRNANELLVFKAAEIEAELKILKIRKDAGGDTDDIEFRISKLKQELTSITIQQERANSRIEKQVNSITRQERDRLLILEREREIEKQRERDKKSSSIESGTNKTIESSVTGQIAGQTQIDSALYLSNALIKIEKDTQNSLNESRRLGTEYRKALIDSEIQIAQYYADALVNLSSIAGEQSELFKTAAIAQTIISTYTSATKSYDALSGIPFVGPALGAAAAAAAIANGLANVARISGVAAAGGADFVTTKPTMLIVGDNPGGRERVTVEPLSGKGKTRTFGGGVAMAGGGSLTVDPRFNDGGFVANQNMEASRQVMAFKNIVKNLPPVVASWSEGRAIGRQLEFKEKISKQ